MSITDDFADAVKQTYSLLSEENSPYVQDSEMLHHPTVQFVIYPIQQAIANFIPIVNILSVIAVWGRFIWFYAHSWNTFWWSLLLSIFFQWGWMWVLDAWGWIDVQWVYQIFAPLDENGNYGIVDDWVNVNTWTFAYTIEIIEKDTGVAFDATNETHMKKLKDFTWPYLFEQMNLINVIMGPMWFYDTLWFMFCPGMFVDEDGYAHDGWALMIAKSHELSKMYWGDYSWLEDPYNRKIEINLFTFIGTTINILWGFCMYGVNHMLLDLPAYVSIWTQIWEYFG